MMYVHREVELEVRIESEPSALGEVMAALAAEGIGILAYNAYTDWDGAVVLLVADDPPKAKRVLEAAGYRCNASSVVMVGTPARVGAVARFGVQLGRAGVQVLYSYASMSGGNRLSAIFKTADDERALQALRGDTLAHAA
jgi:hypothetical protein